MVRTHEREPSYEGVVMTANHQFILYIVAMIGIFGTISITAVSCNNSVAIQRSASEKAKVEAMMECTKLGKTWSYTYSNRVYCNEP